jgi:hypothetical protein
MPAPEPQQPAVEVPAQEPVAQEHGEMSFEDAMRAALESDAPDDSALPDFAQPDEPVAEQPPPAQEQQEALPALPDDQEVSEQPAEEKPADRSLARIMEREAKLLEQQAKLDAAQPELEALRTRVEAYESAQNRFAQSPTDFIKSMAPDMDLKRLAETLWYESQGDKAPQAYLEKKAASRHNGELAERIAKIEQGEKERERQANQQAAQQTVAQYQGSLEAFAKAAPAESLPLVAAMQEKNPQWVASTMLEAARVHARATNGQVLSPEQAAQAVEKHIASFQVNQAPPQVTPPTPVPGTSLRNNSTQVQPDREHEDELSDDYLRRKAFEAVGRPELA